MRQVSMKGVTGMEAKRLFFGSLCRRVALGVSMVYVREREHEKYLDIFVGLRQHLQKEYFCRQMRKH